jgi:hypothetical protein
MALTVMLVGAMLASFVVPSFGAFTSTFTQNQDLNAGVVSLTSVDGANSTLTTDLTDVAANDQYTRYATLTNSGDVALGTLSITAAVTAGADTVSPTATSNHWATGVRIYVERCTGTWTWNASSPSSSCGNSTWETVWDGTALGVLPAGADGPGSALTPTVAAGALTGLDAEQSTGLRITYYVCAGNDVSPEPPEWSTGATACNGTSADSALMGSTATDTIGFQGTARAATTNG